LLAGSALIWMLAHRRAVLRAVALAIVTLGSLEVALRIFNAVKPSFVFYADDYNRYRGRPGEPFFDAHFNSQGFNDVEHTVPRPAGVTKRILAIGDSFTVGVVPQHLNYLSQLRLALGADSTEVINMGVAATEPRDYLAILASEGLKYKPDLVLVSVFVGNDFEQSARRPYEYSYVATLVRAAWRYAHAGPLPAAATATTVADYHDDEPTLGRDRFLEIEVDRSWVYEKGNARLRAATGRVVDSLRSMKSLAAGRGADFVVVLIPDEAQVNIALQDEVVRASGRAAKDLDFEQPNQILAAALEAERIRIIDLLPAFRDRGASMRLYKPQDTHWNIAGNALAAEAIGAVLRR
jgi:lysophospholipase L1-like esterase